MVYKWGNIKRSIVKYCRNAFAENGIPVSDGQIELNGKHPTPILLV